jgi:hypothetical protein
VPLAAGTYTSRRFPSRAPSWQRLVVLSFTNDEALMSLLKSDCSRCCGLCCFAPAYLQEQGFPFDKPAERPCRQLDRTGRCSIHAERAVRGFVACAHFDCHGAGQWITQRLFGGARWSDSPELARRMAAAYRRWLPRFEAAALLDAALPLVPADARQLLVVRMATLLDVDAAEGAVAPDPIALRRATIAWIRSLVTRCSDGASI